MQQSEKSQQILPLRKKEMITRKGGLRGPRPWNREPQTVRMSEEDEGSRCTSRKGGGGGEGATYRMRGQCNTSGRQRERVQGPCGRRA